MTPQQPHAVANAQIKEASAGMLDAEAVQLSISNHQQQEETLQKLRKQVQQTELSFATALGACEEYKLMVGDRLRTVEAGGSQKADTLNKLSHLLKDTQLQQQKVLQREVNALQLEFSNATQRVCDLHRCGSDTSEAAHRLEVIANLLVDTKEDLQAAAAACFEVKV